MGEVLLILLGITVASGVTWAGSGLLEDSSRELATRHRLPPVFQGAVITAVGSSFPELATAVLSPLLHGRFDLGLAAIVGSAIFNVLVIPGLAGLAGGGLRYDLKLVYKDALFYVLAIAGLLLTFSFALIYAPAGDGEGKVGTMSRALALIPLALYGLYLFLHQQDAAAYRRRRSGERPAGSWKAWVRLAGGLALILLGVEALLRAAIRLGELSGTPSFLWGITVVAAATSLPDAFVSIRAAKSDDGDVSVGNVLGSNIFDLLVAVPLGVLVAGAATVDYAVAAPLMGFLTLATAVLLVSMRVGLSLGRREAVVLLALYVSFVAWMVLEVLGTVQLVG